MFMMGGGVLYIFTQEQSLSYLFFSPDTYVWKISCSSQSPPVSLPRWKSGQSVLLCYALLSESLKLSILIHALIQQPITEA